MKKVTNLKLHEEFKLYENMWESLDNFDSFDFDGYDAGTTTYDIAIDGSDKKAEGTYPGPEALRNILKFINNLTQEEKDNLGLGWWWDSDEPGDCNGDTIVYIVAPSEAAEWKGRSGSNLPEAEAEIRKALGISLDEPNILMEAKKALTESAIYSFDLDAYNSRLDKMYDDKDNLAVGSPEDGNVYQFKGTYDQVVKKLNYIVSKNYDIILLFIDNDTTGEKVLGIDDQVLLYNKLVPADTLFLKNIF
jgi:hypothetical protein